MIMSDDYYITNLDIITIGMHFNAPIVIITGTRLRELSGWKRYFKEGWKYDIKHIKLTDETSKKRSKVWVVNVKDKSGFYYFVKQPGIKRNEIPKYKLISTKESKRLYVKDMKKSFNTSMVIYNDRPTFEQYIESYKRFVTKTKRKLKQRFIIYKINS